jgi:hypothetical protein
MAKYVTKSFNWLGPGTKWKSNVGSSHSKPKKKYSKVYYVSSPRKTRKVPVYGNIFDTASYNKWSRERQQKFLDRMAAIKAKKQAILNKKLARRQAQWAGKERPRRQLESKGVPQLVGVIQRKRQAAFQRKQDELSKGMEQAFQKEYTTKRTSLLKELEDKKKGFYKKQITGYRTEYY